jgi:hypothetical protein
MPANHILLTPFPCGQSNDTFTEDLGRSDSCQDALDPAMHAATAFTAAFRWLGMLADATHRPPLAASSTTVSDCAYPEASLSSL